MNLILLFGKFQSSSRDLLLRFSHFSFLPLSFPLYSQSDSSISNNKKRKCSVVFKKKLFSLIFGERSCGVPINSSKNADSFLTLRELRLFLHTFQREYMLRVASVIFFPCKDLPESDFIYFSLLTFFIIIYHLLL